MKRRKIRSLAQRQKIENENVFPKVTLAVRFGLFFLGLVTRVRNARPRSRANHLCKIRNSSSMKRGGGSNNRGGKKGGSPQASPAKKPAEVKAAAPSEGSTGSEDMKKRYRTRTQTR